MGVIEIKPGYVKSNMASSVLLDRHIPQLGIVCNVILAVLLDDVISYICFVDTAGVLMGVFPIGIDGVLCFRYLVDCFDICGVGHMVPEIAGSFVRRQLAVGIRIGQDIVQSPFICPVIIFGE